MKGQAAMRKAPLTILLAVFASLASNVFASQFTVMHNFRAHPAAYPASGLIADAEGNFYGTTAIQNTSCPPLCGTVFELAHTSSGYQYHVIHNFRGPQGDGELPFGRLLFDSAGNLYGTTFSEGDSNCTSQHADCGTVFKLSRTVTCHWSEKVLYRFKGGADGAFPAGNLVIDSAGNLYGTAFGGGSFNGNLCRTFGCGAVFELSPSASGWTETVLYNFTGGSDGWRPAWLTPDASGNLLGVAESGGTVNSTCGSSGCGTVYKLSSTANGWALSVLYSFSGGSDGAYPSSQLIFDPQGNLYGAAAGGGLVACDGFSCGTIFELSPNGSGWSFSDVYSFSGPDGELPRGILFDSMGNMFGVADGGKPGCPSAGCGVLFKLVPGLGSWAETVLYTFQGTTDGEFPNPVIFDGAGNLFGTAVGGGSRNLGTLFEFTP
jgi:uncharacterized repeat protein (TIGR03803 family)